MRDSASRCSSSHLLVLQILLLLLHIVGGADLYETLEVNRGASDAEIRQAYRKLAKDLHPDRNPSHDAASRFAEVAAAYEVLGDDSKRKTYDRHGEEGLKRAERQQDRQDRGGFSSMFEAFGFGRQQPQEARTPNMEMPVRCTLKALYLGDTWDLEYTRKVLCINYKDCETPCPECHGPGVKVVARQLGPGFVQQTQVADKRCIARGKCGEKRCKACPRGLTEEVQTRLTVDLERGAKDGDRIVFEEATDESPGAKAGDIVLKVRALKHEFFEREGDDLSMTMKIPLVDALLGFRTTVEHLDGHIVVVEKEGVTSCGSQMHIQGEGMPMPGRSGEFGDMVVKFVVDFPSSIVGKENKEALRRVLG